MDNLTQLESRINETGRPQPAQLDSLVMLFDQLITATGNDSMKVRFMLRAAEASRTNFKFDEAIKYYDRLLNEFPASKDASQALFMKGFIVENDLLDIEQARQIYESFIKSYPDHELADDAQFLLDNLGKSDEEIIREFEAKQQAK